MRACLDGPASKNQIAIQTGEARPAATGGFFAFQTGIVMNLDFKKMDGLIAGVVVDHATRRVLMVGFLNEDAWNKTVETGFVTFYSRTRNKLWMKGESSGHKLAVKEIRTECDKMLRDVQTVVEQNPDVCSSL